MIPSGGLVDLCFKTKFLLEREVDKTEKFWFVKKLSFYLRISDSFLSFFSARLKSGDAEADLLKALPLN